MGLIKAALGAASGVLGDQWKEYFYCDALPADVIAVQGEKRRSGRSSNRRGGDNIITDGSVLAVANGQCALIVEQGKVVELCAEPGEYTYQTGTQPSLLSGSLPKNGIEDVLRSWASGSPLGDRPPQTSGSIISTPRSWWATNTAPPALSPSGWWTSEPASTWTSASAALASTVTGW